MTAVTNVVRLYEKAALGEVSADLSGDMNIKSIKRFYAGLIVCCYENTAKKKACNTGKAIL